MQKSSKKASQLQALITVEFRGELYDIQAVPAAWTDYVVHGVDCPTSKDAYASYDEARRALQQRSEEEQRNKRIYRCEVCGYYHFTTKPGSHRHAARGYDRRKGRRVVEKALSGIGEKESEMVRRKAFSDNRTLRISCNTLH